MGKDNSEQIQKMPMQELIEHLEQQAGVVASEDYRLALEDVISWCNKHFLEKQKQSDEQKDKRIAKLEDGLRKLIPLAEDGRRLHINNAVHQEFLKEDDERISKAIQLLTKNPV